MPLFLWKPSYEVGIPEIDYDHRHLVGLINQLYEAMKQGHGYELMSGMIDQLIEYTHQHFATEESFMRAKNYPHLAGHEAEHQQFRERVQLMDCQRRDGTPPPSAELLEFLCDWLRNHVTTFDKDLGKYLKHLAG